MVEGLTCFRVGINRCSLGGVRAPFFFIDMGGGSLIELAQLLLKEIEMAEEKKASGGILPGFSFPPGF